MFYQNYLQDESGPSSMSHSCYVYHNDYCKGYPDHFHAYLEFIYVVAGEMIITREGVEYFCTEGDLIFVPMLEVHQIKSVNTAPVSTMILQLSHSLLGYDINQQLYCIGNGAATPKNKAWHVKKNSKTACLLQTLIENCSHVPPDPCIRTQAVLSREDIIKICRLKGTVMLLVATLLAEGMLAIEEKKPDDGKIRNAQQLQKVFQHVSTHPEQPISMQEAATMCGMSYYSFCRVFKQLLGYSFVNYQNMMRIRYAEDLLLSTDMTVTEISEKANFGNLSYFNRIFKKQNAMSPSAFRKHPCRKKG